MDDGSTPVASPLLKEFTVGGMMELAVGVK